MSTNFPTSLDNATDLPTIGPTDSMDSLGKEHDVMHNNLADAVKALEVKVGVDSSTDPTSLDYKITHVTGTKTWFGAGTPSTFHSDGDLYFDTTALTFAGYVQQLGQIPTQTGTIVTGTWSSSASHTGTITTTAAVTTLLAIICYENASNGAMSINSMTSTSGLTWTLAVSNHSTYGSRNQYTEIWYAQPTGALTSEVVSWTFTGGNVDDAGFFLVPLIATITGADPFVDGGTTGLPAAVAQTGTTELTTGTITAPANTLFLAISARDASGLPGVPSGFTSIANIQNAGASRYEYANLGAFLSSAAFTGTFTSSGLASQCANFIVIGIANNPTYRSWQPFN